MQSLPGTSVLDSSHLLSAPGSWLCPHSWPLLSGLPCCSPKIFQKTKCSICNSALELPSVHFLCGHSFHQHCFESYSESDADCPTCLPENRKVMDMIRAQEQKRDLHDQFQHQVGVSAWITAPLAEQITGALAASLLLTEDRRPTVLILLSSSPAAQVLQRQLLCDCGLLWPRCFQQIDSPDRPSHGQAHCKPGGWVAAGPAHALQEGHLSSLWGEV